MDKEFISHESGIHGGHNLCTHKVLPTSIDFTSLWSNKQDKSELFLLGGIEEFLSIKIFYRQ